MPNILKDILKCKHPNSRKTIALAKKAKKINNRGKVKLGHAIKANIMGEKLSWFTEQLENQNEPLTPLEFLQLFEKYFQRFNEELEGIDLKQSISKNRSHQHASRKDAIKMTLDKEISEFNSGGIELIDLCDPLQFKAFKEWNGSALNIQHLKKNLISRNSLNKKILANVNK